MRNPGVVSPGEKVFEITDTPVLFKTVMRRLARGVETNSVLVTEADTLSPRFFKAFVSNVRSLVINVFVLFKKVVSFMAAIATFADIDEIGNTCCVSVSFFMNVSFPTRNPTRRPAKPSAFEHVRSTKTFRFRIAVGIVVSFENSAFASSMTIIAFGNVAIMRLIVLWEITSPVGLFGLHKNNKFGFDV